jgi:osmotically inducible protein OsmC
MRTSTSNAQWNGVIKSGSGEMLLGDVSFPYSFNSRMEGGPGSTPEEMLGAALAGCYSMALSGGLERAGFPGQQVKSNAKTNFDNVEGA